MRPGCPARNVEQFPNTEESKDGQKNPGEVPHPHDAAIPALEFEKQQHKNRRPYQRKQDQASVQQVEGEFGSRALDQVRRNDDGQQQLYQRIQARTRQRSENCEQQQPQQQDVRQLRVYDAVERKRHMHADVGAAAQQVAVVHDEDEGGKADALAELLQHLFLFEFL